jgi:hypothetical protein
MILSHFYEMFSKNGDATDTTNQHAGWESGFSYATTRRRYTYASHRILAVYFQVKIAG